MCLDGAQLLLQPSRPHWGGAGPEGLHVTAGRGRNSGPHVTHTGVELPARPSSPAQGFSGLTSALHLPMSRRPELQVAPVLTGQALESPGSSGEQKEHETQTIGWRTGPSAGSS